MENSIESEKNIVAKIMASLGHFNWSSNKENQS